MTLEQLGEQYLEQAKELHSLIRVYSAQLKNLDGIKLYEMNARIVTLRDMERDMRITGKQLVEYYVKPSKKPYVKHYTV